MPRWTLSCRPARCSHLRTFPELSVTTYNNTQPSSQLSIALSSLLLLFPTHINQDDAKNTLPRLETGSSPRAAHPTRLCPHHTSSARNTVVLRRRARRGKERERSCRPIQGRLRAIEGAAGEEGQGDCRPQGSSCAMSPNPSSSTY